MSAASFRQHPLRQELLEIYAEVEVLLAPFSCPQSAECCQFGITGREPYPSAIELAELRLGLHSSPPRKANRADKTALIKRPCPLLGDDLRCRAYASRPFGCRTFFCSRATGPGKQPRKEILALGRRIADLSARFDPIDPLPRPLTRALNEPRRR